MDLAMACESLLSGVAADRRIRGLKGVFPSSRYQPPFYYFLYEREYPIAILNMAKNLGQAYNASIKEFVMGIHTGESLRQDMRPSTLEDRQAQGQVLLVRLAQDILVWADSEESLWYRSEPADAFISALRAHLELDGYMLRNGQLVALEPNVLDEEEELGLLGTLARECKLRNLDVLQHHLDLADIHYRDSKWDDCIANSRKYMECVLREVADSHCWSSTGSGLDKNIYDYPVKVRIYLETQRLLSEEEVNAFRYVYGLLSDTGGHPYIAERDQARLARNLALSLSQFILLRHRGWQDGRTP